jgi:hypothetical protein
VLRKEEGGGRHKQTEHSFKKCTDGKITELGQFFTVSFNQNTFVTSDTRPGEIDSKSSTGIRSNESSSLEVIRGFDEVVWPLWFVRGPGDIRCDKKTGIACSTTNQNF